MSYESSWERKSFFKKEGVALSCTSAKNVSHWHQSHISVKAMYTS